MVAHLLRVLALRLKLKKVSPLTPLYIRGKENSMTDIPSCSFGSEPNWHRKTDADLPALFNNPPNQQLCIIFCPSYKLITRVILLLRMKPTTMEMWRRLPNAGTFSGTIGVATLDLWEWTLTFRKPRSQRECSYCLATQPKSDGQISDKDTRCKVDKYLKRSRPLARKSPWPSTTTP